MKNIGYSFNGFTTARLKRFLRTGGQSFTFIEWEKNNYNEPTETVVSSKTILGVLHTSSSSTIDSSASDTAGSKVRSDSGYSIITSWESLVTGFSGGKELSPGMSLNMNGVEYKIIKVANLHEWGIVAQISLEEYDEWRH